MKTIAVLLVVAVLATVSVPYLGGWQEILGSTFGVGAHKEVAADHHSDGHGDENAHSNGHVATAEAHHAAGGHHAVHKIVVTSPVKKNVVLTQKYVCQIRSCRHIDIRALERGYLQEIAVREGQFVKQGDILFKVVPTLYEARLAADLAEQQLAQVEYDNTQKLMQQNIVSEQELKLAQARLAKAEANVKLARAEVDFTIMRAPFDGIVDRLHEQIGSLIEEGCELTTLSDNSVMWVYFNVPEVRYLELAKVMKNLDQQHHFDVKLQLANHTLFPHQGKIGAIEADFNNETGNIAFRADIPNPEGVLRHGQTGNILIDQVQENCIVIPQRATYEILAKKYVFVVDENHVVHQREIVILNEKDDIYILESGVIENDHIVYEGIRQVRDGDKIKFEYREPEQILSNLKYHAE